MSRVSLTKLACVYRTESCCGLIRPLWQVVPEPRSNCCTGWAACAACKTTMLGQAMHIERLNTRYCVTTTGHCFHRKTGFSQNGTNGLNWNNNKLTDTGLKANPFPNCKTLSEMTACIWRTELGKFFRATKSSWAKVVHEGPSEWKRVLQPGSIFEPDTKASKPQQTGWQ